MTWSNTFGARAALAAAFMVLAAFVLPGAASAQFTGGNPTGISVATVWVPLEGASWGTVPAGGGVAKATWIAGGEPAEVAPGKYDVYWAQDESHRQQPMLLARNVAVVAGEYANVAADSGVQMFVAPWVPARAADGWWGATAPGADPATRINWTNDLDTLLLPAGTYDIYWMQDHDPSRAPLRLAAGVKVRQGFTTNVYARSGVELIPADWVPKRDRADGWWGVVDAGDPLKVRVAWTRADGRLLVPPGTYDVVWAPGHGNRDVIRVANDILVSDAFAGVGIELTGNGDNLKVLNALADLPAARAGIRANDVVVAVDGEPVKGRTLSDAVDRIRGSADATVSITVRRDSQTLVFAVERTLVQAVTAVRINTGVRPMIQANARLLDPKSGMWSLVPAWGKPVEYVARSVGSASALPVTPGFYDVYWQQDGKSEPLLKSRVEAKSGKLVGAVIGPTSLTRRPSVLSTFAYDGDIAPAGGATWRFGVRRMVVDYGWTGAAKAQKFGIRWYKDGELVFHEETPVATPTGKSTWRLETTDGKPLPAGNYRIEFTEDGELRYPQEFIILADAGSGGTPRKETPHGRQTSHPQQ